MPALLAHCRRELFHGVWRVLLDQEFCTIYEHGVIVTCADGIVRRVFPRIFTYSADYPEKYVRRYPIEHIPTISLNHTES